MHRPRNRTIAKLLAAAVLLGGNIHVAADRQYTFAWRIADESMAPRGGTTQGQSVTLDPSVRAAFQRIREVGLVPRERDRRAILAMAGEYRATFDFLELAGFRDGFAPDRPYQSWGTEKVYVVTDTDRFVSLQHLLVMNVVDAKGNVSGPFVTQHWRQDWTFEPDTRLVYRGANRWERIDVPAAERDGAWAQSVWQVDGSPRYSGIGRWQHVGNYSSWVSGEEWRPLPRREFSVRHDYQVLSGTNRHTITPTGWIQEELNLKVALGADGAPVANEPVLAREVGLNRYESITGFDWSAGDRYFARTQPLWDAVRAEWRAHIESGGVALKAPADQAQLFGPLFEYAEALNEGAEKSPDDIRTFARTAVEDYLLPSGNGEN